MKKIIAVRHGHYYNTIGDRSKLSDHGREEALITAKEIDGLITSSDRVAIFCSPHTRAVETAEIISSLLGVDAVECSELGSMAYRDGERSMEAMLEQLGEQEIATDILIAVTHHEAPSGIINAFRIKDLSEEYYCHQISNGGFLLLNLKKKYCRKIFTKVGVCVGLYLLSFWKFCKTGAVPWDRTGYSFN